MNTEPCKMRLDWLIAPTTKTWQVAAGGLFVALVSGATRYAIKHDVRDAFLWGVVTGVASVAAGAFRLLRKGGPTDQPERENLPPYGREWPPAH